MIGMSCQQCSALNNLRWWLLRLHHRQLGLRRPCLLRWWRVDGGVLTSPAVPVRTVQWQFLFLLPVKVGAWFPLVATACLLLLRRCSGMVQDSLTETKMLRQAWEAQILVCYVGTLLSSSLVEFTVEQKVIADCWPQEGELRASTTSSLTLSLWLWWRGMVSSVLLLVFFRLTMIPNCLQASVKPSESLWRASSVCVTQGQRHQRTAAP